MIKTPKYLIRNEYLNDLIAAKDKDIIKVVTGIRRCGKSTLFKIYIEYLKQLGVTDDQIIVINLEDIDFEFLDDYKKLHDYVKEKLIPNKKNYVFLDEVQTVDQFEKACDSLYIKENVDLYITGSNAHLLSGELATLLAGRYIEIKMLPFSFKEYSDWYYEREKHLLKDGDNFTAPKSKEDLYNDYVFKSSFPYASQLETDREVKQFLDGVSDSIYIKDIMSRKQIYDLVTLQTISKFMFDNIGNITSSNKIADTMTSEGKDISYHTVNKYISALTEAFLFYKCDRYDIKGKNILKTGEKYYATDVGMRYNLFGRKDVDYGHILENIVYLELIRRGYRVFIGKIDDHEVDFVAIGELGEEYYQVAYHATEEKTLERELKSHNLIKDHNPKYLLTMDKGPVISYNGIKKIYVLDWLLGKV